jgi:hypothetical protein
MATGGSRIAGPIDGGKHIAGPQPVQFRQGGQGLTPDGSVFCHSTEFTKKLLVSNL